VRTDAHREHFAELDVVRDILPQVYAAQDQITSERRLPPELANACKQAGLFRLLLPAEIGGSALDLQQFVRCIELLGEADGSAGWCVAQGGVFCNLADRMTPAAAGEIWSSDINAVVATGTPWGTSAQQHGNDYRLSGQWRFASGVSHATWLGAMSSTTNPDGEVDGFAMFLVPRSEIQVADGWDVAGLRGTGSFEYQIVDHVVPEHRVMQGPVLREHAGAVTKLPAQLLFASGFGAVGLGIARRALNEVYALIDGKTPVFTQRRLRDDDLAQSGIAEAEAMWAASRAYLFELAAACAHARAEHGDVSGELRTHLRLAATSAMRQSSVVVDRVYQLAGSDVVFAEHPIQRCFQDIRALTQQIQARSQHYRTVGRVLLGLEADYSTV
jgi:indole-3-acetate monooxygenase